MALKTLGRYDEALSHLRVAADEYPRDRVVLDQIGRIQFLQRQFDEAIAAYRQAIRIDLPGGLAWIASYNNANQKLQDYDLAASGLGACQQSGEILAIIQKAGFRVRKLAEPSA